MSSKEKGSKKEKKPAEDAPAGNAKGDVKPEADGPKIRRNVKPDKNERDKVLGEIEAEMKKIQKERDEKNKKIKELFEKAKGGNEGKKKLRDELKQIVDTLKAARAEKDKVFNEVKAVQTKLEAIYAEEKKMKESMGRLDSVEKIEAEIEKLEKQLNEGRMTAREEKDVISKMNKLKLSKKNVSGLENKGDDVKKLKQDKKDIEVRLNEKKAIVDEIQKRFTAVKESLTEIEKKEEQGIGAQKPVLMGERDKLNSKFEELMKKKNEVYSEFSAKMKEFIEAENERRRLEQEKRQEEEAERQKAYEEKQKALEEEEMKKKPWEAEIAQCDSLIAYLQKLSGQPVTTPGADDEKKETPAAEGKKSTSDFGDMKLFKRGEDLDYILPTTTKKKGGKKSNSEGGKGSVLTHSIETINLFQTLSLSPPVRGTDIEKSLTEVKEKRDYYDVLPRAPKPAKAAKPAAAETPAENGDKAEGSRENKKAPKANNGAKSGPAPNVLDQSSFPSLSGAKEVTGANTSWGKPKPTETGDDLVEASE